MKAIVAMFAVMAAGMPVPPSPVSPTSSTVGRGEVAQIDQRRGTISIRHGALPTLQLNAATTVFPVKDKALLDQTKAGDTIEFKVEHATGMITTIRIERAKQ